MAAMLLAAVALPSTSLFVIATNPESNDLSLRKSEVIVERISVCSIIEYDGAWRTLSAILLYQDQ